MPATWTTQDRGGHREWTTRGKHSLKAHVRPYTDDVFWIEFSDWAGRTFWQLQGHSGLASARKHAVTIMHKLEAIFESFVKLDRSERLETVYRMSPENCRGTIDGSRAVMFMRGNVCTVPPVKLEDLPGDDAWTMYLKYESERRHVPGWLV